MTPTCFQDCWWFPGSSSCGAHRHGEFCGQRMAECRFRQDSQSKGLSARSWSRFSQDGCDQVFNFLDSFNLIPINLWPQAFRNQTCWPTDSVEHILGSVPQLFKSSKCFWVKPMHALIPVNCEVPLMPGVQTRLTWGFNILYGPFVRNCRAEVTQRTLWASWH